MTVPVVGGTGNATVEFVNKYIAPYSGKTDLGCSHYKYWASALIQQLHFVDDDNVFDRGNKPLSSWVDLWESLNGGRSLRLY